MRHAPPNLLLKVILYRDWYQSDRRPDNALAVGSYTLSREADADIEEIAQNSIREWHFARAEKYILGLHESFGRLAEFPDMGRDVSYIRAEYKLLPTASHLVFYRKLESGIVIVRVLHARMDFARILGSLDF